MGDDDTLEMDHRFTASALAVLRIVTGLLFLQHGTGKILGFPESSMAFPQPWSLFWLAGWMELIGSLMLIVGLFTRPVAFLLAGEMAVAYWYIHAPKSGFPMISQGESAVLFCFIFLLYAACGAGKWSLDGLMASRRSPIEGYAAPGGERTFYSDDNE